MNLSHHNRKLYVLLAATVAAIGLMIGLTAKGVPSAGADAPSAAEEQLRDAQKSDLLVTAAPITDANGGPYLRTVDELNAYAAEAARSVPLPPGGTLDDAQIEAAAEQGGAAGKLVDTVAQFNASCDWYHHALKGDPDKTTLRVIGQIPRWSAFRGTPVAERREEMAAAVRAGDRATFAAMVASECVGTRPPQ